MRKNRARLALTRIAVVLAAIVVAVAAIPARGGRPPSARAAKPTTETGAAAQAGGVVVNYPLEGSIFPPEITAPTFLWHDETEKAVRWQIEIQFADGAAAIRFESEGKHPAIGEIDPRCVAPTNEMPALTAEMASAHSWKPAAEAWEAIKKHTVAGAATVTIRGYAGAAGNSAVSSGEVTFTTSRDAVGAPIFYRDVPLMPSETEKGIIKPLAQGALHLVQWRLRDLSQPESRIVLKEMPTCGNCHSFSLDGKTMGMDLDGPANNKGLYAVVPVQAEMAIRNKDVISWSSLRDESAATSRIGFMSQVSPDGRYVLTNYRGQTKDLSTGYFTVNYKDYRFLQVFYPTRSIVAWYDRATGKKHPLPGADDPQYVQTNAVWSPDGRYVVFVRATAMDPYPPGNKMPQHANDPEEPQIRYDLYRVPFNEGKGGTAVAIEGASHNGMSNSFPKVSPDGRWIVWVKCRNAQLMRPDSQLYIVPAGGGVARKMRCNTPLMNSWHSFSPNGRWMVFSSKSRSYYTQMYLTHIDEQGNDSPAILIDNATAANRAVNIPEFVNIPPSSAMNITTPAVDVYNEIDRVTALENSGQIDAAIAGWKALLVTNPEDARLHNNLGTALVMAGKQAEAVPEFEKALEIDPEFLRVYFNLGRAYLTAGEPEWAIAEFRKGLEYDKESADLHYSLGLALASTNQFGEAKGEFEQALKINPQDGNAHFALGVVLARQKETDAAIEEFREALRINPKNELAYFNLGEALRKKGDLDGAIAAYRDALRLNPQDESVHYSLGLALGRKRDLEGEAAEMQEVLRLNAQNGDAHRELGLVLAAKGDANGAIAEERAAVELDPKNDVAHVYLGTMLGQQGNLEAAVTEYREALQLNPKNSLAHYNLGVLLETSGDRDGALKEYRAAHELSPAVAPYQQAYERLAQQDKP